jgi:hypothetical protein
MTDPPRGQAAAEELLASGRADGASHAAAGGTVRAGVTAGQV